MATDIIVKEALADPRIVQPVSRFAIPRGGSANTNTPFTAITKTTSQLLFNVNVPSQQVFLDRAVDIDATAFLQMSVIPAGAFSATQQVWAFGRDGALCAFPINSMLQSLTATINDTSITIQLSEVFNELARLVDYVDSRKMRTCPYMLDNYCRLQDGAGALNNPYAGYNNMTARGEVPNGAWYAVEYTDATGSVLPVSTAIAYTFVQAGNTFNVATDAYGIPLRTQTTILGVPTEPASYPIYWKFRSIEKIFCSPFIFADQFERSTAIFGLNNFQLLMTLKADISRVVRSLYGATGVSQIVPNTTTFNNSSSVGVWGDVRLNCLFISASLEIPLPSVSSVPYMEFPRYTSQLQATIANGATSPQLQSQSLTLSQVPELMIWYCKKQSLAQTEAEWYLPITNISLTFDNTAGILSTTSREQLYQLSYNNGLMMDYQTWLGSARVGSTGGANGNNPIATTGGFLVIKPGIDFPLSAGVAPGLLGNFVVQAQVSVFNQSSAPVVNPNLVLITINSGFFQTLAGSSRVIKSPVSEADILGARLAPESDYSSLTHMVGSGLLSSIGNALSKAKRYYDMSKPTISAIKNVLPDEGAFGKVKGALGAVGYGKAGSGASGAGMSRRLM